MSYSVMLETVHMLYYSPSILTPTTFLALFMQITFKSTWKQMFQYRVRFKYNMFVSASLALA